MTSFQYIGSLRLATVLCFSLLPDQLVGVEGAYNVVDRSEVLAAMRQHYGGYELTATTNGLWLAEVVFSLVRQAKERDSDGPPLFIGHEEWFQSLLTVTE
jgi:hypothetical protein